MIRPESGRQVFIWIEDRQESLTLSLVQQSRRGTLRVIGREKDLVPMNRTALSIAKARRTGTQFAGDLCNTNIYDPGAKQSLREVERIFAEQMGWAAEVSIDYIVAGLPCGVLGKSSDLLPSRSPTAWRAGRMR